MRNRWWPVSWGKRFNGEVRFQRAFRALLPLPEEAVSSLARAVEYAENCKKPVGKIPKFPDIERGKARRIIEKQ